MSSSNDTASYALQVCFGVAGILSVVVALLGLHYRDSLGCVLCGQLRKRQRVDLYELEAGPPIYYDGNFVHNDLSLPQVEERNDTPSTLTSTTTTDSIAQATSQLINLRNPDESLHATSIAPSQVEIIRIDRMAITPPTADVRS